MSVSVTLKSYFYEVLIPSSQKNTSSPIEDILHHVSISFMKKLALYKCFNPRTHTGCDYFALINCAWSYQFQSTHPHGVRQHCLCHQRQKHWFQSTHPHGVRLKDTCKYPIVLLVSIHAPTRGATDPEHAIRPCLVVSIHAPTRGATSHT